MLSFSFQKGGSLHGKYVDATPFASTTKKANGETGSEPFSVDKANGETESNPSSLVDDLGKMLREKGFNYHGVEVLYSGVYGTELKCEIFIGPVYYQRLRHMVSDKFQVRIILVFPSLPPSCVFLFLSLSFM